MHIAWAVGESMGEGGSIGRRQVYEEGVGSGEWALAWGVGWRIGKGGGMGRGGSMGNRWEHEEGLGYGE